MGTELAVMERPAANGVAVVGPQFTEDQIGLLKRTICKDATDDEFQLFLGQCKRTRLDPFAKQIHAVKRYDSKSGQNVMAIQTGIDGYRLIAERTGQYEGQTSAMWCGEDGVWKDVWLSKEAPAAAKVGVHKAGFKEPVYAVALWSEYVQQYFDKKSNGWKLSPMWAKMGALMLSKCAESLALRKAFPQELSGIYTAEEMAQADRPEEPAQVTHTEATAAALPPPEEPDQVQAAWRKWRAAANKSFQAAKSREELEKKRAGMEEVTKQGPSLWARRTYHNESETFGSLYAEHFGRVERDEVMAGPEGIKVWIAGVMKAATVSALASYVAHYRENDRFQTQDCEEALHDRARQLGLNSYTDCEADEHGLTDRDYTDKVR